MDDDMSVPVPVEEQQPEQAQTPQQESEKPLGVETAFVVILDDNGHWVGTGDLLNRQIIVRREATIHDFFNAASTMVKDLNAMEGANRVIMAQQQMGQAMIQQMEHRRIAEAIGDPTKPNELDIDKLARRR